MSEYSVIKNDGDLLEVGRRHKKARNYRAFSKMMQSSFKCYFLAG